MPARILKNFVLLAQRGKLSRIWIFHILNVCFYRRWGYIALVGSHRKKIEAGNKKLPFGQQAGSWFSICLLPSGLRFKFLEVTGGLDSFATRKDWWVKQGLFSLSHGHIDPLLFSFMTSALTTKHKDSGYDRSDYLRRVIQLYTAKSAEEIAVAESADSEQAGFIERGCNAHGLEAVKIHCLIQDVVIGTNGRFTENEMNRLISMYQYREQHRPEPRQEKGPGGLGDNQKTYSAFSKDVLFPLIRTLSKDGKITEEQVAVLCCINFHSRERRRRSGERTVDHPMGVAELVLKHAGFLGLKGRGLDLALMAALMHDIGEKSNLDIKLELSGIISRELWKTTSALHKLPDDDYLDEYIGVKCALSRITVADKLCDSYHNSLDADPGKPSFKQAYIYPIIMNYLLYCLENQKSRMSIREFVAARNICSTESYDLLRFYVNNNPKVEVSKVAVKIPSLRNVIPPRNIFDPDARPVELKYDHLYGKDNSSLHNRPNVQSGYRYREVS